PSAAVFFFFSSRRRHTRFSRDWSSDVCSSDLFQNRMLELPTNKFACFGGGFSASCFSKASMAPSHLLGLASSAANAANAKPATRSEERRVGKECTPRRHPHHAKKDGAQAR